jgi:DegV family protein with EDD domain
MIMQIQLVLDSSADITSMEGIPFAYAPLKVSTADRDFTDDDNVNTADMVDYLASYKGRSTTSCPNVEDWLKAFGEASEILCITITGGLSGSYNTACTAKEIYESEHPDRRVVVIDSKTAGPEITLMAEKARDLAVLGKSPDEIAADLKSYKTELLFMLESLRNFANNGRVSKAVAMTAGVLGIRAIGRASDEGTLEVLSKARGAARALEAVLDHLKEYGYKGGKVRIHHCFNEETAHKLAERIRQAFPAARVVIAPLRGLCSFYAEKGGVLLGFEA